MDKLLELLNEDARLTSSQLAVMLDTTEEDIELRIEKLEQRGIIKGYKAIINWENTEENRVSAIIELKVTPKRDTGFDGVAKILINFDEVESVYLMAGAYDIAAIVHGKSMQEIATFVSRRLATMDFVISTSTNFILSRYKDSCTVFADEEDNEEKRSLIL